MKFRRQFLDPVFVKQSADGAASTETTAVYTFTAPVDCYLESAYVLPNDASAANSSNYATISLLHGDGAAGTPVVAATVDTSATAFAAGTKRAMTLSSTIANLHVLKGETVGFKITKTGTGVVVGANTIIQAHYRALKEV